MASSSNTNLGLERKSLFALLAVLAVRGAFALIVLSVHGSAGFISQDSPGYISLAQSLLQGKFGATGSDIFRTPGYPLLLVPAVVFRHTVLLGILENFALSFACACLIWHIARKCVEDVSVALLAVLLFAFEPISILVCNQLLSDLLFTFLILLFIRLLIGYLQTKRMVPLLVSVAVLGAATYVRPASLYLGLWVTPVFLLFPPTYSWRRRFAATVLFLSLFAATLVPWIFRNAAVADYRGFSSAGDAILYFYSVPAVRSKLEGKTFAQIQSDLGWGHYLEKHPDQASWPPGQIARYWHSEALRVIAEHKLAYLALHARGCAVVLFDSGGTVISTSIGLYPQSGGLLSRIQDRGIAGGFLWLLRYYPRVAAFFLLLEAALLLSYLLAIVGLRRLPFDLATLFVWVTLYFVAVSGSPAAVARYRVPFITLICILAAAGLAHRTKLRMQRRSETSSAVSLGRPS